MQTLSHPHLVSSNNGESISLWMDEELSVIPLLYQDITTDVCIIGSGITGSTCAYFLLKRGF